MGFNKNDATSFEEMAEEQAVATSAPAEPVAEVVTDETTESTIVDDKTCDCENCDCDETPNAK